MLATAKAIDFIRIGNHSIEKIILLIFLCKQSQSVDSMRVDPSERATVFIKPVLTTSMAAEVRKVERFHNSQ